ncbi:MAG: BACON domain-containing protein [Bacteroidaceae bacterium]|nr:BACON domain-containing protein [Bacteroidaceae bacterium]
MKKILIPVLALSACLSACNSENEFHQTSFDAGNITMYADQVRDSVLLYYTDNWTATLGDASWLTLLRVEKNNQGETLSEEKVATLSGTMPSDALMMSTPLYFTAEPNTSGFTRTTSINVSSHQNASIAVLQLPVLNITYPYYRFKRDTEISTANLEYVAEFAAGATEGYVIFTTYRDGATLTSDQPWCVPQETAFTAGTDTVTIAMQPNTEGTQRTAILTLTSAGVSTDITFRQAAKTEE